MDLPQFIDVSLYDKYHLPETGFAGADVGISKPFAEILPVAYMFEVQVIIPLT